MIRPIARSTVHRICSGQVVLSLSSAIKELVENSLDAGATLIEVKTFEHGIEMIEVCDNGSGVKATDFESLTLKHHTSKIRDFSDVASVDTFGFRGEALSSLCAVSDLEIVTRHEDTLVGASLTFDRDGSILSNLQTHRSVGTTVRLRNLFSGLPVRHKEFVRNVRREFSRAVQLLSAYCLVCVGCRVILSDRSKGKKTVVLSTNGSLSCKDNILALYGQKQVESLMAMSGQQLSREVAEEFFLSPETSADAFKLEGFVSSSWAGRSTSDRQFYFINGRPCDLPKVSKVVNDVYRSFNRHQFPFVFLNVILNEGNADVNVTPDKRQIFVSNEKVLLALVKSTLMGMYEKQPAQMTPLCFPPPETDFSLSTSSPAADSSLPKESKGENLKRKLDSSRTSCGALVKSVRLTQVIGTDSPQVSKKPIQSFVLRKDVISQKSIFRKFARGASPPLPSTKSVPCESDVASGDIAVKESDPNKQLTETSCSDKTKCVIVLDKKVTRTPRRCKTLDFCMDMLRAKVNQSNSDSDQECSYRRFRSRIVPSENGKAEEELKKEIRKEDFTKMEVIGQFNLGFVVVRLREDLFIVDQHASDEKFNFEQLQRQEQLQTQPLVHPQELHLSAVSEAVLLEHEELFQAQGFQLQVDLERPVGRRAHLVACPLSHTCTFGQEDIEELIFLLADNPVRSVRPSRVNQMFASRACRKSVMVGTHLSKPLMRKLIQHMGEIEQPWNCPHGRPTIRHLFNLKFLKS